MRLAFFGCLCCTGGKQQRRGKRAVVGRYGEKDTRNHGNNNNNNAVAMGSDAVLLSSPSATDKMDSSDKDAAEIDVDFNGSAKLNNCCQEQISLYHKETSPVGFMTWP